MRDSARDALLGPAVSDALSTTLEFSDHNSMPPPSEVTGGGLFGLKPGQSINNTNMPLLLAKSLLRRRSVDASDVLRLFTAWHRTGAYSCISTRFDIGTTTQHVLSRYGQDRRPARRDH